jgi:hypothetical protein
MGEWRLNAKLRQPFEFIAEMAEVYFRRRSIKRGKLRRSFWLAGEMALPTGVPAGNLFTSTRPACLKNNSASIKGLAGWPAAFFLRADKYTPGECSERIAAPGHAPTRAEGRPGSHWLACRAALDRPVLGRRDVDDIASPRCCVSSSDFVVSCACHELMQPNTPCGLWKAGRILGKLCFRGVFGRNCLPFGGIRPLKSGKNLVRGTVFAA